MQRRQPSPGVSVAARPSPEHVVQSTAQALLDLTVRDLLSAIGARTIAGRSGTSTASLYRRFGSMEGLARAVIDHVFDARRRDGAPGDVEVEPSLNLTEQSLRIYRETFDRTAGDPELRLRIGLWGLGGPDAALAYGSMLRTADATAARQLRRVLASRGLEVRRPLDERSFVALQTSLVTASAMRSRVDPDGIDASRFARAALAASRVLLHREGDSRTIDDRLTEINYFPLRDGKGFRLTDKRRITRARILDVAAEAFADADVRSTSITTIASMAQVSTSTVYEIFHDVDDLALHLFLDQAADVLADLGAEPDLGTRLREVATFVAARRRYAGVYVARLAAARPIAVDPLLAAVESGLPAASFDRAHGALVVLASQVVRETGPDVEPVIERAVGLAFRVLEASTDD